MWILFGHQGIAMGRVLIAAGVFIACACMQRWSEQIQRDRKTRKHEELNRWEGEGGAPRPDRMEAPAPVSHASH
jgi:hypothetical protein